VRLNRCDRYLNDAISALDERLHEARRKIPKATPEDQQSLAWTLLSAVESQFVQDEIKHCMDDRVYYLGAYHVIRPEQGPLTCLFPFRDHQWQVEEMLTRTLQEDGEARIIILKERQSGMTEYCCGVMCWRTFFIPDAFTVTVAQDPDTSSAAQRKIVLAYNSLPWWLRPELMYFTKGSYMELGRKDAARAVDQGMGSVFANTHAMKQQGVAIGRTVRSLHGSEVSRWPDGEVYTGDIEPSMNAADTIGFMESTAWGNEGFFYNMWEEAMSGDSDWKPIFLAAYRDTRRRTPILSIQQPFKLTEVETAFTERVKREENYDITPEFWNWRRKRIRSSIARTGFPYAHYEGFPISPQEAFQSSGQGAFPRHKLDEQQQKNVCKPTWVGEILFQGRGNVPKVLLNSMLDENGHYREDIALEKREMTNRLYLWEQPDPASAYYIGVDVGDGIMGGDFSVAEVFKAGYGMAPDIQVGEWVGYEPPIAFAKIVYALGFWYNQCEIAVEYAKEGTSTANALRLDLEYPKLYIPRRPDSTTTPLTHWVHWQTTGKTKPYLLTRMNESLLEDSIVIRSQYLLDELRRCVKDGMSFAGMGGHDDAAVAGCICHYCLRETMPELRQSARSAGSAQTSASMTRALHPPVGAVIYGVYDPLYRLRHQRRSLQEAEADCAANPGWTIRPIRVSKANTAWSSIHHGRGLENELYAAGMADREITPGIVTQFAAATGRLEGMFNQGGSWGSASPGADAAQWDSSLGDLGSGELGEWSEMR
jgi:hypothetical protein